MSLLATIVIPLLAVCVIAFVSFYGIDINIKRSRLDNDQLEAMIKHELHVNKPMFLTRVMLYMLVFSTYKDICPKHDLSISQLRDLLLEDENPKHVTKLNTTIP